MVEQMATPRMNYYSSNFQKCWFYQDFLIKLISIAVVYLFFQADFL